MKKQPSSAKSLRRRSSAASGSARVPSTAPRGDAPADNPTTSNRGVDPFAGNLLRLFEDACIGALPFACYTAPLSRDANADETSIGVLRDASLHVLLDSRERKLLLALLRDFGFSVHSWSADYRILRVQRDCPSERVADNAFRMLIERFGRGTDFPSDKTP